MDIINWNSSVRDDLKMQRTSPFGTPAELACKFILELCQEIGRGSQISQKEHAIIDSHIQALNSNYYCCCFHVIVLQWLASLLLLFYFVWLWSSQLTEIQENASAYSSAEER